MKKAHVLVECEGTGATTQVYNVDEKGTKVKIPNVTKAELVVEAGKPAYLNLTVVCPKVTGKIRKPKVYTVVGELQARILR